MINWFQNNRLLALGFHFGLGFLAVFFPLAVKLYVLLFVLVTIAKATISFDENQAYSAVYYMAALGIIVRANASMGIPHEIDKYFAFLIFGIIYLRLPREQKKGNLWWWVFIFVLIPGMFFTQAFSFNEMRKLWIYNLLGTFLIPLSIFVFKNKKWSEKKLFDLLYLIVLPIFTMTVYIIYKAPELDEIKFATSANFATSGGYGPNQVATILGLGIFILGFSILRKHTLFRYKVLDIALLLIISLRSLLTFSRGGTLAAVLGLLLVFIFDDRATKSLKARFKVIIPFLFIGLISAITFMYVDGLTGGLLTKRYLGQSKTGTTKVFDVERLTSNRNLIMARELTQFDYYFPFGTGVGNSGTKLFFMHLDVEFKEEHGAHTEYTRLLGEHGILGLIALIILVFYPISYFLKHKKYRYYFAALALIGYFSLVHSATRMAIPSILIGLAYVKVEKNENQMIVKQNDE